MKKKNHYKWKKLSTSPYFNNICINFINIERINIFFIFKKKPSEIKLVDRDNKTRLYTYLIPTLLFIGSIPEAYSFANVPAFTVVAVSMVNMIMSLTSDIKNKRLIFNLRTALFIVFVLVGVSLNVFGRLH